MRRKPLQRIRGSVSRVQAPAQKIPPEPPAERSETRDEGLGIRKNVPQSPITDYQSPIE